MGVLSQKTGNLFVWLILAKLFITTCFLKLKKNKLKLTSLLVNQRKL